jgi:hypothetical protein
MNVSAYSIRNPIPSILLFVMLTLAGLLGFHQMKIQQFPDIDLPTILVRTPWLRSRALKTFSPRCKTVWQPSGFNSA